MENFSELNQALASDIGRIAETLTQLQPVRAGHSIRFGARGSLSVQISGRKAGSWFDHEAGQGGGPLQLIQHYRGCDHASALQWAKDWTGAEYRPAPIKVAEPVDIDPDKADYARAMWGRSISIDDTRAEKYLLDQRRIPKPVDGWPSAVRYHADSGSLIVAATTDAGAVQAVQIVRLAPDGGKAPVAVVKRSHGPQAGCAVRFPGPADGPLVLCEGPETGLSVWRATGHETHVLLGSISKAEPPAGRVVVIACDDDARFSPASQKRRNVIRAWKRDGLTVVEAHPHATRRADKSDFNDAMKDGGITAVQARFEAVLNPVAPALRRMPVEAARAALRRPVAGFFSAAASWHEGQPIPVHAIRADLGLGKSDAARKEAAAFLMQLRADGDKRTVAIAVPTLALADEQAKAFNALNTGMTAAVWRGRDAPDPDALDQTMCRNTEAVEDAQKVLASVEESCCAQPQPDETVIYCPFYHSCGYQKQKRAAPDLWVFAHNLLFSEKPKAIGELAALIVDENPWQAGLFGINTPSAVNISMFDRPPPKTGNLAGLGLDRLSFLRNQVFRALADHPDNIPLERDRLIGAISALNAKRAATMEYERKLDAGFHPDMNRFERDAAREAVIENMTIPRMSGVWNSLAFLVGPDGPARSGNLKIVTTKTKDGPVRQITNKGRHEVCKGWRVPTLLIDATLKIDLIRHHWPDAIQTADIVAETPNMRIIQVDDKSYALSHFCVETKDQEKRRLKQFPNSKPPNPKKAVRNVEASIGAIARRYAGQVLVVVQKGLEELLIARNQLPRNVVTAHHGAVKGRDEWGNCDALIVVGRTQPGSYAVENYAEAMTGHAVDRLVSPDGDAAWYPQADAVRFLTDGSAVACSTECHPDPLAELFRQSICEDELLQVIGRARGVNRTEANPVDVFVMTNVVLPVAVDELIPSAALDASPADLMMARGGVIIENAADASRCYPELWSNLETAKKAMYRAKNEKGTFPNIDTLIGKCPFFTRGTYRLAGEGRYRAVAHYDPGLIPDIEQWLSARLGPLDHCAVDRPAVETPAVEEPAMNNLAIASMPDHVPALSHPGDIYRGPMIEPPPSEVFRVGKNFIQTSPDALLASPKGQPQPLHTVFGFGFQPDGQVVPIGSEGATTKRVAVRWLDATPSLSGPRVSDRRDTLMWFAQWAAIMDRADEGFQIVPTRSSGIPQPAKDWTLGADGWPALCEPSMAFGWAA